MTLLDRLLASLGFPTAAGPRGERVAASYLKRQSYRILARNLRLVGGEIDILAEAPDRRTIVIVEVKSGYLAAGGASGGGANSPLRPEEHVNFAKQRKLTSLAVETARRFKLTDRPIRFDVIGVDLVKDGEPHVRHHVGAFESRV
jgi:putative endonuclease